MTLIGSEDARQRAQSLIEELLTERNNTYENVEYTRKTEPEPEKKSEIDWATFDWGKANQEYVCFTR